MGVFAPIGVKTQSLSPTALAQPKSVTRAELRPILPLLSSMKGDWMLDTSGLEIAEAKMRNSQFQATIRVSPSIWRGDS